MHNLTHIRNFSKSSLLLLFISALAALLLINAFWPYGMDDSYITFRYAKNWLAGHGIVWNAYEAIPTEGYSNFLFIIFASIALYLSIEPILFVKIISVFALLFSFILIYLIARFWLSSLLSALAVFLCASNPYIVFWTTSGLETTVYLFFVLAAFYSFFRVLQSSSNSWIIASSIASFGAALTRFDGIIVAIVISFILVIRLIISYQNNPANYKPALKTTALYFLCLGIPYLIYFIWRWQYYQLLLPNAAYCKRLLAIDAVSAKYQTGLINAFFSHMTFYIILASYALYRIFDLRILALALLILANIVIYYGADPIVGHYLRYFISIIPFIFILAICACKQLAVILWSQYNDKKVEKAIALTLFVLITISNTALFNRVIMDTEKFNVDLTKSQQMFTRINELTKPTDRLAFGDIGLLGYYANYEIIDTKCLNNRVFSQPPVSGRMETYLPLLFANPPEFILLHSLKKDSLDMWQYMGGHLIAENDYFKQHYELIEKFTTNEQYFHFFLYKHKGK